MSTSFSSHHDQFPPCARRVHQNNASSSFGRAQGRFATTAPTLADNASESSRYPPFGFSNAATMQSTVAPRSTCRSPPSPPLHPHKCTLALVKVYTHFLYDLLVCQRPRPIYGLHCPLRQACCRPPLKRKISAHQHTVIPLQRLDFMQQLLVIKSERGPDPTTSMPNFIAAIVQFGRSRRHAAYE